MSRQLDGKFVGPRPLEVVERGHDETTKFVELQPAVGEATGRTLLERLHVRVEGLFPPLGFPQEFGTSDIARQAFCSVGITADDVPVAAEGVLIIVVGLVRNAKQIERLPRIEAVESRFIRQRFEIDSGLFEVTFGDIHLSANQHRSLSGRRLVRHLAHGRTGLLAVVQRHKGLCAAKQRAVAFARYRGFFC